MAVIGSMTVMAALSTPDVVGDVMTRNVHVVAPYTRLRTIARVLSDNQVSAVPVLDAAGVVLGMVSAVDIVARMADGGFDEEEMAGNLMSKPVAVADPDMTVDAAIRLMVDKRLRQMPVVDANGRLRGIVSRGDLLKREAGPRPRQRGTIGPLGAV